MKGLHVSSEESEPHKKKNRWRKTKAQHEQQDDELAALKEEIELIKAHLITNEDPSSSVLAMLSPGRPRASSSSKKKGGVSRIPALKNKTMSYEDLTRLRLAVGKSRAQQQEEQGMEGLHKTSPGRVGFEGDEEALRQSEGVSRTLMARRIRELEDEINVLRKTCSHYQGKAKDRKARCGSLQQKNSFLVGELKVAEQRVHSALRDKSDQTKLLMEAKRTLKMEKVKNTQLKTWNQHLEQEVNLLRRDLDTMTRGVTTLIHNNEALKAEIIAERETGEDLSQELYRKAIKRVREALTEEIEAQHSVSPQRVKLALETLQQATDPNDTDNRILQLESELKMLSDSKKRYKRLYAALEKEHERLRRFVSSFAQVYAEDFDGTSRTVDTDNLPPDEERNTRRPKSRRKMSKERRPSAGQRLNELQRLVVQNAIKRVSPGSSPASSPASSRNNSPRSFEAPEKSPRAPPIPSADDEQSSPTDESPRRRMFYPVSVDDAEESGEEGFTNDTSETSEETHSPSSDKPQRVKAMKMSEGEKPLSPRTPSIPPGGDSALQENRQKVRPIHIGKDDSSEERRKEHRRYKFVMPASGPGNVRGVEQWRDKSRSFEEDDSSGSGRSLQSPRTPSIPSTTSPPRIRLPEASPRRVVPLKIGDSDEEDEGESIEVEL